MPRTQVKTMRPWLCLAALLLILSATPGLADYNDPRTTSDCNIHSGNYVFSSQRNELSSSIQRCLRTASGANWIRVPVCGWGGSRDCAALEQQRCELDNRMRAIRDACLARLRVHQLREVEREQRERERQRQEAQAREEQAALMRAAAARAVTPGGVSPAFRPAAQAQRGAMIGGMAAAQVAGIPVLAHGGALHLSNAFTLEGTRVLQSIQQQTLAMLEASLTAVEAAEHQKRNPDTPASGPYSRRSPYPLDQQVRQQIEEPFQQAARTAAMDGQLPFGGESAVEGSRAQYLTELAEDRANGTLTEPFWSMDVGEALAAPLSGGEGVRAGADIAREPGLDASVLREQRMAALTQVQQGRASLQRQQDAVAGERRRAEDARRNANRQASPGGRGASAARVPAGSCVKVAQESNYYSIYNLCSYPIQFLCAYVDPTVPYILKQSEGFTCTRRPSGIYRR
ncbi:hypothetical protein MKI84_01215 [Ancylobacter sp. A5.8]|uniref:hypothetical protein n=1 Tax=Ancylobacter gelatini TaxID=2919920 RepID=UPI001F4DA648|nr:hypothetical protein [Ancylobacter gelatini]MCJ8141531.1 hypothetical protein [Ancylobacter gelatini]